jgi:hypothetical protein
MSLKQFLTPVSPATAALQNGTKAVQDACIAAYNAVHPTVFQDGVILPSVGNGTYTAAEVVAWLSALRAFIVATDPDAQIAALPQ